jgi:hypothetical protein
MNEHITTGKECRNMRITGAVLIVLSIAASAPAQQRWTKTYGGVSSDVGNFMQQTVDGGYIIAGGTNSFGHGGNDVYLIKTNSAGDTVWTRAYGGGGDDEGYCVQQTADTGYIIVGFTLSLGTRDVYLIKTNAAGDTLWTRTYGGAGNDLGYSVQQTADRGYIVTGVTYSFGAGGADLWLLKTNASGDTLWTRTYGGALDEEGHSVRQTSDSGYVVTGYTKSVGGGTYQAWLIKTNRSGDTTWTRTYGWAVAAAGSSVRQTSDRGYVIAGYNYPSAETNYDLFLVKTNTQGDTLWTRTYGGAGADYGYSVWQTSDGGYIVAGTTRISPLFDVNVNLVKTNASGDTLWTRKYGGGAEDRGNSVQQTLDGGYAIAGYTNSFGAGYFDVYLIKTDANGSAGVEERQTPDAGRVTPAATIIRGALFLPAFSVGRQASSVLLDLSGRKVMDVVPGANSVRRLSSGVYFVQLTSNGFTAAQKFVVQR